MIKIPDSLVNKIFDIIVEVQDNGITVKDFLIVCQECWTSALQDKERYANQDFNKAIEATKK